MNRVNPITRPEAPNIKNAGNVELLTAGELTYYYNAFWRIIYFLD